LRRGVAVAVCAALTSVSASCSGERGALSSNGANVVLCLPAAGHRVVTDAEDELEDHSGKAVTLRSVTPLHAHGLRLVGPALLPIADGNPPVGGDFPPTRGPESLRPGAWAKRTSVGQALPAGVAEFWVVFGAAITPGFSTGTSTGTRVEYEQDGDVKVVTIPTALVLVDTPRCDSVLATPPVQPRT